MEIAVVGAGVKMMCQKAAIKANAFTDPSDAAGRIWDLLALSQSVASQSVPAGLRTNTLLLPGDSDPSLATRIQAIQVIGYGFSPRDTLTFSSFSGPERLICLQRSLLTLSGTLLEPQELPFPPALSALSAEQALLAAGILLLTG